MNYIFPKHQKKTDFKIIEDKYIFKIKNIISNPYDIIIFGIIFKLTNLIIMRDFHDYLTWKSDYT